MVADVMGAEEDDDDYQDGGQGFKREEEADYDFMWAPSFRLWKCYNLRNTSLDIPFNEFDKAIKLKFELIDV